MRRQSITALAMLIGGGMLALITLVWLSARITRTIEFAETTDGDFAALYLLGDGTAILGALTVAIATPMLLIAGVATASVGYLRIANPGPSPLMIRSPGGFNPQPREIELAFKGKY